MEPDLEMYLSRHPVVILGLKKIYKTLAENYISWRNVPPVTGNARRIEDASQNIFQKGISTPNYLKVWTSAYLTSTLVFEINFLFHYAVGSGKVSCTGGQAGKYIKTATKDKLYITLHRT